MALTPTGLRIKAYGYRRLAQVQATADSKRRMASAALFLAQLAEKIQNGNPWTGPQIDLFKRELPLMLVDEAEEIGRYLDDQHTVLAANDRAWWREHATVLDALLGEAIAITGADIGNVQIFDADANALKIAASRGFDAPFLAFFVTVHNDGSSACAEAIGRGAPIMVADVAASDIFAGKESGQVMLDAGARAVQSTPIVGRAGQLIGMVSTHWHSVATLADDRRQRLNALIGRAAPEIEALATRYARRHHNARR